MKTATEVYCKACDMVHREVVEDLLDVILLGEHWTVNQYMGESGFPGWLVMQPIRHRMRIQDFESEELQEFWVQFMRVESALREAWPKVFPGDVVERVYITLFFENVEKVWHLHFHVVPRTKRMMEEIPNHYGWDVVSQTTYDECVLDFRECTGELMALLNEALSSDG